MMVFVVLGEYGEYVERHVFVAGVFASRAEAEEMIERRLAAREVYKTYQQWKTMTADPSWEMPDASRQACSDADFGVEPEYAERFEIVEADLGQEFQPVSGVA